MRPTERGFTLLEVLAAIAILGLLYTVLTDSAIEGLRSEKTSLRRLEASLVADRWLNELEMQLGAGGAPPLGELDEEDGDFRVRVVVKPYPLTLEALATETGKPPAPVLSEFTTDGSSPLREIQVIVVWEEAAAEYQVTRTTFGFDTSALDPNKLPEVQPTAGAPQTQPTGGTGTGTQPTNDDPGASP